MNGNLREAFKHATHIQLKNLPPLATTSDVKRAVAQSGAAGVTSVNLIYRHFRPTGEAMVSLSCPDYLRDNLRRLKNTPISGFTLKADPMLPTDQPEVPKRTRGFRGREQAVARGALSGDGPFASLPNHDRTATIWGFPGKATVHAVADLLKGFDLAKSKNGKPFIYKIPLPEGTMSMYSRFLVQLNTVPEAHRVVRRLHMMQLPSNMHTIQAQLIN